MVNAAREFLVKYRKVFLAWGIIGIVVHLGMMFYFEPWTSKLGVANSPQRAVIRIIADFWVLKLPFVLLAMSIVAGKMRWLAPR